VLSFLLALSSVDRQQIIKALILYVLKTNILLNTILVVISKKIHSCDYDHLKINHPILTSPVQIY